MIFFCGKNSKWSRAQKQSEFQAACWDSLKSMVRPDMEISIFSCVHVLFMCLLWDTEAQRVWLQGSSLPFKYTFHRDRTFTKLCPSSQKPRPGSKDNPQTLLQQRNQTIICFAFLFPCRHSQGNSAFFPLCCDAGSSARMKIVPLWHCSRWGRWITTHNWVIMWTKPIHRCWTFEMRLFFGGFFEFENKKWSTISFYYIPRKQGVSTADKPQKSASPFRNV